ncbi:MAG: hypothetical protein GY928_34050 [Colwellia sp.]|nr:hypothetical protein [Colwellia sp.]
MGNYVQKSDIDSRLAKTMGNISIPNTDDIDIIILSLESRLEAGFQTWGNSVPLTNESDKALVKLPLINGVSCQAHAIHFPDHETPALLIWCQDWSSFIKRVEDGKVKLPSTTIENEEVKSGISTVPIYRSNDTRDIWTR